MIGEYGKSSEPVFKARASERSIEGTEVLKVNFDHYIIAYSSFRFWMFPNKPISEFNSLALAVSSWNKEQRAMCLKVS